VPPKKDLQPKACRFSGTDFQQHLIYWAWSAAASQCSCQHVAEPTAKLIFKFSYFCFADHG
jgi:hypothetical protein